MSPESVYKSVFEPALKKLDPETAHDLAIAALKFAGRYDFGLRTLERVFDYPKSERLRVEIAGISFQNPLFLAGGFDKNGQAAGALSKLGFGSMEVGTVVRYEQTGNDKPRLARLSDGSLFNKMGFPSKGVVKVKQNLEAQKGVDLPLGVSIGVNKDRLECFEDDLWVLALELAPLCEYLVINATSPNTANLRDLFDSHAQKMIVAVKEGISASGADCRIFMKLSPDSSDAELDKLIKVGIDNGIDGVIATNTSNNPNLKNSYGISDSLGGISGAGLAQGADHVIDHIYKQTSGSMPVVGSGGVSNLPSALQKFGLGAKALSVYTGFVNEGPFWPSSMLNQLDGWMASNGVGSVDQLVGYKGEF